MDGRAMNAPDKPLQAQDIAELVRDLGRRAKQSAGVLRTLPRARKDAALSRAAALLRSECAGILAANDRDVATAQSEGRDAAFIDRLRLTEDRIEAMAHGLDDIVALPDPVGETIAQWTRPNGLAISRVRVPIGTIAVIYESRPNVTADAGALCLKSGNAVILRGGSESAASSAMIVACLRRALAAENIPQDCIQLVPTTDRSAVGALLGLVDYVDLVVPRGGRSLIDRVTAESRVPVLKHYEGLCHVYVDREADIGMARDVVGNAKMRRVGVCGAAETLLIDRAVLGTHLAPVLDRLIELGCEVRGDAEIQKRDSRVHAASDQDWRTEYLAPIISVAAVEGVAGAVRHIETYGSQHTDAIITENQATAERFIAEVDSAIVMHNASTQFADGGEFGLGAEIGISTNRMHARGPVGLVELTTYKNIVRGRGTVRP